MFVIRKIVPFVKYSQRCYSKSNNFKKIKEITETVDPFSNIKINCNYTILEIKPYDLLDCPDANKLKASVFSNSNSCGDISIKITNKNVEISDINMKKGEKLKCLLEVPVKSDLDIESEENVQISEMYSDQIKIESEKNIVTKNLRSTSIILESENGNINCDGLTLANKIDIHTENNGNINLYKLQGDLMHCKTEKGNITTNSCYVETSKFVTESGILDLKNVHKKSEIYILKRGKVNMSGIHGNIYLKTNGADLNLQFSEIFDDNIIFANDSKNVIINISDSIEKNCFIEIHANKIILDKSLSHIGNCLENDSHFCLGNEESYEKKLRICTSGELKFGKMSWEENLKLTMGIKDIQ